MKMAKFLELFHGKIILQTISFNVHNKHEVGVTSSTAQTKKQRQGLKICPLDRRTHNSSLVI